MVSEPRLAENMSAVGRSIQEIRRFGSQASPVTREGVLSIQSDMTALPGNQAHTVHTTQLSSGLVNRVHKAPPAARSLNLNQNALYKTQSQAIHSLPHQWLILILPDDLCGPSVPQALSTEKY